jgi:hypothetical protein
MISPVQISVGSDTPLNKFFGGIRPKKNNLNFVFLHEFKTEFVKVSDMTQGSIWG